MDKADLAEARRARDKGETENPAFARLYDRHAPVVLSLCRVRLRNLASAEDATQETFIRAHRLLDKLESAEKLRPWLYAIARRVCAEQRRSEGRRAAREERAMSEARTMPDTPAQSVERAEQLGRLSEALAELPDDERLAIHLYYLEADAPRAANEAIGISRSGFYKLLARARGRLTTIMTGVTAP
jgi:RNA polymerase sigma-70 factor (ECF subfamily)